MQAFCSPGSRRYPRSCRTSVSAPCAWTDEEASARNSRRTRVAGPAALARGGGARLGPRSRRVVARRRILRRRGRFRLLCPKPQRVEPRAQLTVLLLQQYRPSSFGREILGQPAKRVSDPLAGDFSHRGQALHRVRSRARKPAPERIGCEHDCAGRRANVTLAPMADTGHTPEHRRLEEARVGKAAWKRGART